MHCSIRCDSTSASAWGVWANRCPSWPSIILRIVEIGHRDAEDGIDWTNMIIDLDFIGCAIIGGSAMCMWFLTGGCVVDQRRGSSSFAQYSRVSV